ncbi:MAG: (2Fe-2S)-binding protein [Planctomycetota bacterium]
MAVDRCVCHDVTFEQLITLHRAEGLSLQQLADVTGCTTGCGTCRPYIEAALRTGVTDFPVLNERELAAHPARPRPEGTRPPPSF